MRGHAPTPNLRSGHYELGLDRRDHRRIALRCSQCWRVQSTAEPSAPPRRRVPVRKPSHSLLDRCHSHSRISDLPIRHARERHGAGVPRHPVRVVLGRGKCRYESRPPASGGLGFPGTGFGLVSRSGTVVGVVTCRGAEWALAVTFGSLRTSDTSTTRRYPTPVAEHWERRALGARTPIGCERVEERRRVRFGADEHCAPGRVCGLRWRDADGSGASVTQEKTGVMFNDRLQELVGRPVSDAGPTQAADPVNQAMIRHWAAAFEDWNPVYIDAEEAARSRFGEIVAPPLMLQTWTMATPQISGIAQRGGSPVEGGRAAVLALLDEAGFVGTLASNSEFEIVRYLRLGDVVSATTVLESVSAEKRTRLGAGHFVTWVTTYTDAAGDVVGRQRFRILKFRREDAV